MTLSAHFSKPSFRATFQSPKITADTKLPVQVNVVMGDKYDGDYIVTPKADEEQVLPTRGKTMEYDLTVSAIPQNYGLITWNGTTLTVS